ncbi:nuclease-related domain-containing protein [Streptomyces peucetius]|uniref:NERD domain-containing protein n=1 Tax=Streptomyces peucetius TaxID=1950 RepID=A0ABY6IBN0_STRPE|nr:NERD domain-containing protein [Streptomyces peucetius]UYQ64388.1 NERD domain-containing protein [Streptomyces peucetius]
MLEELTVTAWQYFGHDRLYVNLPDGTPIGWADRRTGGITVVHARYRDDVTDMLARRAPELLTPAEPDVRVHPGAFDTPSADPPARSAPPVKPPVPSAESLVPSAEPRPSGMPPAPSAEPRPVPPAPPAPPRSAAPPSTRPARSAPPLRPAGLPELTPETDLASQRPGATLRATAPEAGPGESGLLERLSSRVQRRRPMDAARRKELLGERRTGAELGRLTRHGWRVLHSIPLPDGGDIDHLLIGPGGVFSIRTEYHPQQSVRAADDTVTVDDGDPRPYITECRAEAALVQQALERHTDFPVTVQPVLVLVDAASLDVAATQTGIRVYRERQLSALAPLSGALTAHEADRLYDIARRRGVWAGA